MRKYYTRACNFFYGTNSQNKIKLKDSLPIHGNSQMSFDSIELISRDKSKKIKIHDIHKLNCKLKNQVSLDIKNISKKKFFKKLNFSEIPLLMGVLNVTPDSFSDGGRFNTKSKAYNQAKILVKNGCDIIDIGGESTRPGSKQILPKKEWYRISKPLKAISKLKKFISIDSRNSYVMERAKKYKINLINDISGLTHDPLTFEFLKTTKLPFIIHHIKGNPRNMQ